MLTDAQKLLLESFEKVGLSILYDAEVSLTSNEYPSSIYAILVAKELARIKYCSLQEVRLCITDLGKEEYFLWRL